MPPSTTSTLAQTPAVAPAGCDVPAGYTEPWAERPRYTAHLDVGFFARDNLPEPLAGSGLWVEMAFAAIDGKQTTAFFDQPRNPTWRTRPDNDA